MKVLINHCYGGYGISDEAIALYIKRTGITHDANGEETCEYTIPRDDKDLITIVEEIGTEKASGEYSQIEIVEIPDGVSYSIDEYDGFEGIDTYLTVTREQLAKGFTPEEIEALCSVGSINIKQGEH